MEDRLFHIYGIHGKRVVQREDNRTSTFNLPKKSWREKTKEILEYIPVAGHVIIWLWRILNLPHWFYRLSRHFEGVVEQVDTLIHRQTEQDKEVDQLLYTLNSFKEEYDSIIHNIHTKLDSFSDQLHAILDDQKNINQLLNTLNSFKEEYDSIIHNIHTKLDSFSDQLHAIITNQEKYGKNLNQFYNTLQSIIETTKIEESMILDVKPILLTPASDDRDEFYFAFENAFRGTEAEIEQKQRLYLPFILETLNSIEDKGKYFLDAGCGRGEFIKILKGYNIPVKGITINEIEYNNLRNQGLEVELIDINTFLEGINDNTLMGISSFQMIEHLSENQLKRFLALSYKKIALNGVIIVETINPMCSIALSNFNLDLTHTRPYPFELLQFMLEWYNFKALKIIYSSPCPEAFRIKNTPACNYMDYALVGWKK